MLKVEENVAGSPNVITERREGMTREIFWGQEPRLFNRPCVGERPQAQFTPLVPLP